MRRVLGIVLLLLGGAVGLAKDKPAPARRVEENTDRSHQLIAAGGSFAERGVVLRLMEELRTLLLETLEIPLTKFPEARPVVCVLNPKFPATARIKVEVVEEIDGPKVRVECAPFEGEPSFELERALLVALLTEQAIRPGRTDHHSATPPPVPRWLVDVLYHKHHHPNILLEPIELRELLDSGRIPTLDTLLLRPEADPIFSTQTEVDLARCLLALLRGRADSREGMRRLLRTDFSEKPLERLQRCFPSLSRSEAELHREWTLQVAASGTQGELIALDGPQTEIQIQNLLQLDLADVQTGRRYLFTLEQFEEFLKFPGSRDLLRVRQLEWIALKNRAHFFYLPVLDVYADACARIALGRLNGVLQRLRAATLERENIAATLARVHDYLNWFEAVEAPRNLSPKMREIYRILDERPKVSDAVRDALDKAEAQMKALNEKEEIESAIDAALSRKKEGK